MIEVEVFGDRVIAKNLQHGTKKTTAGIIIPDDDGKERGIHPRWCQVYKVGLENKDVQEGEWILVEHGRWSPAFEIDPSLPQDEKEYFWYIDTASILAIHEDVPDLAAENNLY